MHDSLLATGLDSNGTIQLLHVIMLYNILKKFIASKINRAQEGGVSELAIFLVARITVPLWRRSHSGGTPARGGFTCCINTLTR